MENNNEDMTGQVESDRKQVCDSEKRDTYMAEGLALGMGIGLLVGQFLIGMVLGMLAGMLIKKK